MSTDAKSTRGILVVEDEPDLARLVALHLGELGYEPDIAGSLDEARRLLRGREYRLAVLDLRLPDGDGLDLCRELRAREDYTPILILTARADETDRVVGLELGADDYLVKPFAIRELVARVKAILRRVSLAASVGDRELKKLEIGGIVIETEKRRVTVNGGLIDLTATEYELLLQLATNPGRVYTRVQLLGLVWRHDARVQEHAVDVHVNRLRAKIEPDPAAPHFVRTVWGVGYRFFDPRERE